MFKYISYRSQRRTAGNLSLIHISICDGDNTPITVKTSDTSVGKVLAKQGISLNEGDETNVALNDAVSNNSVIQINRAIPVRVTINGRCV